MAVRDTSATDRATGPATLFVLLGSAGVLSSRPVSPLAGARPGLAPGRGRYDRGPNARGALPSGEGASTA
ncbi:hypothetical protein SMICM17S_04688 [Streptomyces microflavus]